MTAGDASARASRPFRGARPSGRVGRGLLLALSCLVWAACPGPDPSDGASASADNPRLVAEAPVGESHETRSTIAEPGSPRWETRGYPGVVSSGSAADVAARTAGRIQALTVRLGQAVDRGDLLARVDAEGSAEELAEAEAALAEARSDLESRELRLVEATERQARLERLDDLFAQEEIRQAELARRMAETEVAAARSRLERLRAGRDLARLQAAQSEIRAPYPGTVAARYVEAGAWVSRGVPIVRLVGDGEAWVRFAVPAEVGPALAVGGRLRLWAGEESARDAAAEAESPAAAWATATVRHVAPEVEPASRMIFAEARVDTGRDRLPAGGVVRVFLVEGGD